MVSPENVFVAKAWDEMSSKPQSNASTASKPRGLLACARLSVSALRSKRFALASNKSCNWHQNRTAQCTVTFCQTLFSIS
jgi:hypothetical protein